MYCISEIYKARGLTVLKAVKSHSSLGVAISRAEYKASLYVKICRTAIFMNIYRLWCIAGYLGFCKNTVAVSSYIELSLHTFFGIAKQS